MDIFSLSISEPFVAMLIRLFVCIVVNLVIVDRLYYKKSRRRDFYFTFMLISLAIFFLVFFMIFVLEDMKAKTSIGIGIGLFGIFSIMRYRTDAMPVREMTYLFVIITVAVINGLALNISYAELVLANILVIVLLTVLEYFTGRTSKGRLTTKIVLYDRIENIVPERRKELVADIEKRIGVKVEALEIGHVDFLRDAAWLKVSYYLAPGESDSINKIVRERDFHNE